MEIVGTVMPQEIPQTKIKILGQWTGLAVQAIEAAEQGRVLVVKVADREEYKRMVNGMSEKLRYAGYSREFAAVDEADGVRVFCKLRQKPAQVSVVTQPIARPRKRTNA